MLLPTQAIFVWALSGVPKNNAPKKQIVEILQIDWIFVIFSFPPLSFCEINSEIPHARQDQGQTNANINNREIVLRNG